MTRRRDVKVVYSTDDDIASGHAKSRGKQPAEANQAGSAKLPSNPAAPVRSLQGSTPVRVHRERKGRGGRTVSVITGVMSPQGGKKALLKLLKQKLGTGGALKDETIEIQGDHRERIVELLNELGYQSKVAGG